MNEIGIQALLFPLASIHLMLTHHELMEAIELSARSATPIAWLRWSREAAFSMDASPSTSAGAPWRGPRGEL